MWIRRKSYLGLALAACLIAAPSAHAAPYSAEYVFGDSLSDNGNLADLFNLTGTSSGNFPNPPSYHDSFTNGPVALQLLANRLGVSYDPSLYLTGFQDRYGLFGPNFTAGNNYAVAGAASSAASGTAVINLPAQISAFQSRTGGVADPAGLYVVMIGGNDVRRAAQLTGTAAQNAAVIAGVQTELTALTTLASYGARNFFVVNVPDVGAIPESKGLGDATIATTLSQQYDQLLANGLSGLPLLGSTLTQFDLFTYNSNIAANAAALGFSNGTDPCYVSTPFSSVTTAQCGANAANIDGFLYWDAIHPSARVQALWAQGFEAALNVPEPTSALALGTALLALAGLVRRDRRVSLSSPATALPRA